MGSELLLQTLAALERRLRSTQGKPFAEADRIFLVQDWRDAEALAEAQRVMTQHAAICAGLDYILGWSVQGMTEAKARGGQHPTGGAKFSMSPSTFKELKQLRDQVLAALTPAAPKE